MQLLNNLINIIQGNQLNENVSMLPLAGNIVLPQHSKIEVCTTIIILRKIYIKMF